MAVSKKSFNVELQLHPGDECLGSLEPESLQVLTYIKLFVKDKEAVEIKTSCIPMQFPKEQPPFLRYGTTTVATGAENVITYLQEQLFDVDDELKEHEHSEVMAYNALLVDRLLPAIIYSKWLNSQNYTEATRTSYGKILHFPLSLFYLSWQHRSARHLVMRGVPPDATLEQRGIELISRAEECINLISARLGDQDYFFGEKPSSLDASMFGYLEVILQTPLPSTNSLFMKVNSHNNLVKFCQRLRKELFPNKKTRSAHINPVTTVATPPTLWRDSTLWFSVGVATFVLCVQGVRVGLFHRLRDWMAVNSQRLNNRASVDSDT